jgi:hypothetical protein
MIWGFFSESRAGAKAPFANMAAVRPVHVGYGTDAFDRLYFGD